MPLRQLVLNRSSQCHECHMKSITVHGESKSGNKRESRLYRIWFGMKKRCDPTNWRARGAYSDRGITVCVEWQTSFVTFRDWAMRSGYQPHLTIDRRDNDKGYCPDNCRWATYSQQQRNTRKNRMLTAFGETKSVTEWAEDPRCAVSLLALRARIFKGWEADRAITTKKIHDNYYKPSTKRE